MKTIKSQMDRLYTAARNRIVVTRRLMSWKIATRVTWED